MQRVETNKAAPAIGPYSQAVKVGDMIYTSGQIPMTAQGELVTGDIKAQTRQILDNLTQVLEAGGSSLSQVVKTTIYLTDMDDFLAVNTVYGEYFSGSYPARSTVAVKTLPKNVDIEIDAIAVTESGYSF